MSRFKLSVGPWNADDGADACGPSIRAPISMEDKIKTFAELGFSAVQFHDDDLVLECDRCSHSEGWNKQKREKAFSTDTEEREYAVWRAKRSMDMANLLGADKLLLWFAREGTPAANPKTRF